MTASLVLSPELAASWVDMAPLWRTTVVVTASPLVLDVVDEVALVADGVVVARGTHRGLLDGDDETARRYRSVVSRAAADDEDAATATTTTPTTPTRTEEPRAAAHR